MKSKIGRVSIMIPDNEKFKVADLSKDPRYNKQPQTPGLVESLESQGFRPFTDEW